jgi:hypothetical protein
MPQLDITIFFNQFFWFFGFFFVVYYFFSYVIIPKLNFYYFIRFNILQTFIKLEADFNFPEAKEICEIQLLQESNLVYYHIFNKVISDTQTYFKHLRAVKEVFDYSIFRVNSKIIFYLITEKNEIS